MIFDKVDRLPGVEQMCRDGMAHEMNVTVGGREILERCVSTEPREGIAGQRAIIVTISTIQAP
jgi:hypothetical protein